MSSNVSIYDMFGLLAKCYILSDNMTYQLDQLAGGFISLGNNARSFVLCF